jgi:hypothetical protein
MTTDVEILKAAKKIANGLFAVTDSIVESYEREAIKAFPDLIVLVEKWQIIAIEERAWWIYTTTANGACFESLGLHRKQFESNSNELDPRWKKDATKELAIESTNWKKIGEDEKKEIGHLIEYLENYAKTYHRQDQSLPILRKLLEED